MFISYASENREAARLLRDALAASGLDVWYDENELLGGDAWDQKIRRQIRECTYFMPVISAQTESRRDGYFRREWRLAVDRSHDMADDAMFLIPVVIDATSEAGARVPEKFATVQWLRCPGGTRTPALAALALRLTSGVSSALPAAAPPSIAQARRSPVPPADPPPRHPGPPPMPPFPQRSRERHDGLRYVAEVAWWLLSTAWIVFIRMPKWVRVLVTLWLLFGVLFKSCSSDSDSPGRASRPSALKASGKAEADKAAEDESLKAAASKLEKLAADPSSGNLKSGFAKAGAEIARAVSEEVDGDAAWSGQLELVPFEAEPSDPASRKLVDEVFSRVFSRLSQAHPAQVKVQAAGPAGTDGALLAAAAAKAGDTFLVLGRGTGTEIEVRLIKAQGGQVLWTGHYPTGAAPDLAEQVYQGLAAALGGKPASP